MLLQDVRYALRTLSRSKGFATVAILCLGFGIGLNATIFSLIDGVLADTAEWIVFERVQGSARYLLIINRTAEGREYRVSAPYPRAQLVFWSDGADRTWADTTADGRRIEQSVFVPPFGLVVLSALPLFAG
jgi:hypothetical protein